MRIIINADDFGMSESVTDAILQAFNSGFITQTTAMVNMPDIDRAMKMANGSGLSDRVGLHLNLTEGLPLTDEMRHCTVFCNEKGAFKGCLPNIHCLNSANVSYAVEKETRAQIEKYLDYHPQLMHIDGHHHCHMQSPILYVLTRLLRRYGFKTMRRTWWFNRHDGKPHVRSRIHNVIFFMAAQKAGVRLADGFGMGDCFMREFSRLDRQSTVEIMLHPRYTETGLCDVTDFCKNRGEDCGNVSRFLNEQKGVRLISYKDLRHVV